MVNEDNWGSEGRKPVVTVQLPCTAVGELILVALSRGALIPGARAGPLVYPLRAACSEFGITSRIRLAHFIAQTCWESDGYRTTHEYASGEAYDTGSLAARLGNTPEADGDGQRLKGHGWIMVTGATNHERMANYFSIPHDEIVAWLQTTEGAARSAGYYWMSRGCNQLADQDDCVGVTKAINGGRNGLGQRQALTSNIKRALGI